MKIIIVGTKTHLYELMSPTYRGGPNKNSLFYKENQFGQEIFINLKFIIFVATIELDCNGKSPKSQINQFFLDHTDFFHKTGWFSLVLLYIFVAYELI